MDEILASIRKIIETGDEKAVGANREAAVGAARQIPAFLAGAPVREAADVHAAPADPVPPQPLRFADASATVRPAREQAMPVFAPAAEDDALTAELETELAATWERIEIGRERGEVPDAAGQQATADPFTRNEAMSNEPYTRPFAGQAEPYPFPNRAEAQAHAPAAAEPAANYETSMERTAFEPANTDARLQEETQAASSRYGDTPPPLVSPATGQLVGASFNELAEAIRQGELRSLEAMAQEMLQPMLREWLDDNLPKMVERLIREEIERLARGGAKR